MGGMDEGMWLVEMEVGGGATPAGNVNATGDGDGDGWVIVIECK